jgi:hypothetical protein
VSIAVKRTEAVDKSNPPASHMSLRDYFAAKALPMAWHEVKEMMRFDKDLAFNSVAERSYLMADAMLAERSK